MSNEQFYILIAVPLLGILMNSLVFLPLNARATAVEGRVSGLEARIEARMAAIEARLLSFENTFTTRFDLLMGRLFELERDMHKP